MSTRVRVNMKPVNTILSRLGVDRNGDVQRFVTNTVNKRITRYMPYRSGVLSTKSKHIKSLTEIEVISKYARYMYYGELMVDHITGSAWSPKYGWKVRTGIPLNYHRPGSGENGAGNSLAGPFWDRHLMNNEGDQIAADVQDYVKRRRTR